MLRAAVSDGAVIAPQSLRWPERVALILLAAAFLIFGVAVEVHVAFSDKHRTDLGVFLGAATAVREHHDIYKVAWHSDHYLYPPLLAILLSPLRVTLPAMGERASPGFAVAVAVAYALCAALVMIATHRIARLLEDGGLRLRRPEEFRRRWWALRFFPVFFLLHGIGRDMQLGQVEGIVLFLLVASVVSTVHGRSFRGGVWLSAAICLKVIPAFLLLWPILRRDARHLAGCAVGCLVGLVLVPSAVVGPRQTLAYAEEYTSTFLVPGVSRGSIEFGNGDELSMKDTHNFSLLGTLHSMQYPLEETRPAVPSRNTRFAANMIGLLLLIITLWAAGDFCSPGAIHTVIFFSELILLALLICPQFQSYYFTLLVPLLAGLNAASMNRRGSVYPGAGLLLLMFAFGTINVVSSVKGLEKVRDMGLPLLGTLLLWAAGIVELLRRRELGLMVRLPSSSPV